MRHNWKKGAAALLTASMIFSNISMTGLAEEETAQAEGIATQAEEAPTEAPATEAPTEAPAPATEAPTEAPATEAPTEAPAPATEAPTEAPATEAPTEAPAPATEAQTESHTQATEKQSDTEKKTEKETEEGIYTAEEKNYTISVEVPDDMDLPKGAELVADIVKKDTKEAKEDLKLAKEAADQYEITGYQIYDLHFEKDNKEIELTPREKADIKVTVTIDKKEFQKDLKEEGLEVFHIRDLTDKELEEQKKVAEEAANQEKDQTEKQSEESKEEPTQTAEKLKIKKAEEKDGKETITFSTDGFSDYLFAVTEEKQTEKQSESETVKETETEAPETTAPTEAQETNAPETTAPQIAAQDSATPVQQTTMELSVIVKAVGAETSQTTLKIQAPDGVDLGALLAEKDDNKKITITDKDGKAIAPAAEKNVLNIPVAVSDTQVNVKNLPKTVQGTDGTETPVTYTLGFGGNYIDKNDKKFDSTYYTVYTKAGQGEQKTLGVKGDYTFEANDIDDALTVTAENVYSIVTLSASEKDKQNNKFAGMSFAVTPEGGSQSIWTATADNSGTAVLKGLPAGKYTITGDTNTIPKQYKAEDKSQEVTVDEQAGLTPSVNLTYNPITLTVKSVDSRSGKALANAKITVKKSDGTDKGTTVTTDSNGQAKLTGVVERGVKYTISQGRLTGHYSVTSSAYTVDAKGADASITLSNQPTVIKVGVIDNVSKTSPYSGSYVSGATIEILKVNADKSTTLIKKITTEGQLIEVAGVLDPGVTYQVKQTTAPAGYIVGATNASGSYSVGKQIALSSKTRQEKTVEISADTVKVLVTRKGYDSRTQVTKNGKKAYEYTNLKVLAGARLEIRDKDGNVVKDRNGNPVSWTSSEKGGHLVEGVLEANTEYTLVETGAPTGYDLAGSGAFHTYKSGNQAAVTMQTRRASGTIRVVMRAAYKGNAIKVNGTYYCALFTDKNLTKRYTAAGVRRLTMTTSQVYAEATFENIPAGVYYVAETDKNGNPLKDNATFKVNNPEEGLHMDTSKDLIAEITNDFVTEPAGAQRVSSSELKNSYNAEYAGYGGSAAAAAEMAAGGNSVQTGDMTNFTLYLSMLAAACILFAVTVIVKKRRKE